MSCVWCIVCGWVRDTILFVNVCVGVCVVCECVLNVCVGVCVVCECVLHVTEYIQK